jgi:putative hydrolase of the HAD superfamily
MHAEIIPLFAPERNVFCGRLDPIEVAGTCGDSIYLEGRWLAVPRLFGRFPPVFVPRTRAGRDGPTTYQDGIGMSAGRSIQAVLFDMDETLLSHARDFRALTADLFTRFEDRLNGADFEKFSKALWPKAVDMWFLMYDGVLPGSVARQYTIVNTLRQLNCDLELAGDMMSYWDNLFIENTSLMDDAENVLRKLRDAGLRLGIVTNGYSEVQHNKIKRHGLEPMVDFVIVSEDAQSHKPDLQIYEHALERAGTAAEATIFVGDTPHTDIEGAINAGMISVLIDPEDKHTNGLPEHRVPQHRIKTLRELLPLVNGKR